jgi:uncharacterized protein involved in response to NO
MLPEALLQDIKASSAYYWHSARLDEHIFLCADCVAAQYLDTCIAPFTGIETDWPQDLVTERLRQLWHTTRFPLPLRGGQVCVYGTSMHLSLL